MDADLLPPESTQEAPRRSMQRLVRHLDLFSGIGGFALAAQMVGGIETVGFCEIDPWARRILAKNFLGVPIHDDVKTLNPSDYGRIDLITGGYPCQPFSSAGKQKGAEDDRHLWPSMLEIVKRARPSWVLAENVVGHITVGLDQVLADLESEGYAATAIVIPACAVDARHRRERVWIVANAESIGRDHGNDGELLRQGAGKVNAPASASSVVDWMEARRWENEPRVDRVAHGIPSRVDRIRGLGNAIVPQVAAEILRCMMRVDSLQNTYSRNRGDDNCPPD
jgi:DNA (cytosine-5)-methyltransferase 1